jgi:hypothetical protein
MSTNNFHDTPRIIRDSSLSLREENGRLVLGPEYKTYLGRLMPFAFFGEMVLFAVVAVIVYFMVSQDEVPIVWLVATMVLMSVFMPLVAGAWFLGAKVLVMRKTRLIVSPEQITVKTSWSQNTTIKPEPPITFHCDAAFDTEGRELFDVSLRNGGTAYYILSGYDSDDMNTLCSLLNDYLAAHK